ncbi:MAG: hypothetical protein ACYC63_04945 [Armatimonadota bacterium]
MSKTTAHTLHAAQWAAAVWQSPTALAYLRGRGISDQSIRSWGIGFCGDTSNIMGNRVTFPVLDIGGNVVSISGRTITNEKPKSWHYPFKKERYLFGMQLLTSCPFVVIVEGQVDAILVRQQGYHTVAVMGSSLSPIAAAFLRLFTGRAVVYPDSEAGDEKAYAKALKWLPQLRAAGLKAVFPKQPYWDDSSDDPADLIWDRKLQKMNDPGWLRNQIDNAAASLVTPDTLDI